MRRTRRKTFHQSHVIVAVFVVIGALSPLTCNHARRLPGSTLPDDVGPMNHVAAHSGPRSGCSRPGGRRKPLGLGDAHFSLSPDAPPAKDSVTTSGKGSAGDAAPGKGAMSVSKFLVVRLRIRSTNSCTCGSAEMPLTLSWLAGLLAEKSRTPV